MRTNITVPKRVQGTGIKYASVFKQYICYIQACSVNMLEWFSTVFSERTANYEAFFQMRIKMKNSNIKMTRQKKYLKTVSVG
jgi:hypothetical protein